ncbi:hypothetical protein [Marinitenerispora sediminis]|uniref:Uncharacterized protein n=1 Tax=Marinitenerispora sediminis TaxID=1931232 RepID=A0A368TAJ3_9ACTN|nr:hypothetical protein [Marinitenerispora sediminis]RCV55894.1 hypothetical protein DEF28_04930 [Marinitenerispora sediminis]RCV61983.1 hypothetical protein DEF24_02810 [Marinitenerispora sediminis]RCV62024.1 hypothetical protein DEF23_00680 [Marinitenerispora sediminis]
MVETDLEPVEAVQTTVRRLAANTRGIPLPVSWIVTWRAGVYRAQSPTRCGSWEEAVAEVSRSIARDVARRHAIVLEYGVQANVPTVSLFGDGNGILYQRIGADGRWLEQTCFLISRRYSVQCYLPYSV